MKNYSQMPIFSLWKNFQKINLKKKKTSSLEKRHVVLHWNYRNDISFFQVRKQLKHVQNDMSFLNFRKWQVVLHGWQLLLLQENDMSFLPEITKTTCHMASSSTFELGHLDPFCNSVRPILRPDSNLTIHTPKWIIPNPEMVEI